MILIREIQVIKVDKDSKEIRDMANRYIFDPILYEDVFLTPDMVKGRVFKNVDGEEICISMNDDAQKAVGLPFKTFDKMTSVIDENEDTIEQLDELYNEAFEVLLSYEGMSWWERVKFIFKRRI